MGVCAEFGVESTSPDAKAVLATFGGGVVGKVFSS